MAVDRRERVKQAVIELQTECRKHTTCYECLFKDETETEDNMCIVKINSSNPRDLVEEPSEWRIV